jgi:hypothetical protein
MQKLTRLKVLPAVVAALLAVSLAGVSGGHAHAMPRDPNKDKGVTYCPLVDANDRIVGHVEAGTRISLLVCGSDGEWHFGWLVNP